MLELLNKLLSREPKTDLDVGPSKWQVIFLQSKVNHPEKYLGEYLPANKWEWPKGTWLQSKLGKEE